jgi:hypothetical protein
MKRVGDLAKKLVETAEKAREKKTATVLRKSPKTKEIVLKCYDIGTKDNRSIMDVAVFRLSKKDKRAGEIIRYEMADGYVQVSSGPEGMASIWDYDIVLMAISKLTEAINRYRKSGGEKPGRVFCPHVSEIIRFCRRTEGGKQREALVEALIRLNRTHIHMERVKVAKNGRVMVASKGESLISSYHVIGYKETGKINYVEIEILRWIYEEVVETENPDVLTVHPDFFLINPGIGRFFIDLQGRQQGEVKQNGHFKRCMSVAVALKSLRNFAACFAG